MGNIAECDKILSSVCFLLFAEQTKTLHALRTAIRLKIYIVDENGCLAVKCAGSFLYFDSDKCTQTVPQLPGAKLLAALLVLFCSAKIDGICSCKFQSNCYSTFYNTVDQKIFMVNISSLAGSATWRIYVYFIFVRSIFVAPTHQRK